MYLLDTNVISELRRGPKADQRVRAWSQSVPVAQTFLSSMTIFEIEIGAIRLERRNKVQADILRDWINNHILARYAGRIIPIDTAVAQQAARLQSLRSFPDRDTLIAASAVLNAMIVVTRNVSDFAMDGVKVLNPWN